MHCTHTQLHTWPILVLFSSLLLHSTPTDAVYKGWSAKCGYLLGILGRVAHANILTGLTIKNALHPLSTNTKGSSLSVSDGHLISL